VICHAPQDRAIFRRIPLYWTAVTVGPVLLYSSFRFQHRLVATVEHLGGGGQVASIVGFIFALLSTWLFLLGLYKLMPYTKVDTTAAAIGSIIATVFWTIVTHLFGAYVNWSFSRESSTFTVVYGSLGLIPLFMLWIHALWVIVLYGLEVTRTLMIVGVRLDRGLPVLDDLPPMTDPASIVPVVKVIADRFEQGRLTDVSHIVDRTHFSPAAVEILLKGLVQDGVIYRVDERRRQGFSLARPPARITTDQLMQTAMRLTDAQGAERSRAWDWINRFRADVLKVPSHAPIADM
jgi:membrane protein